MSTVRYRTNEGELIPIIVIIIVNVLVFLMLQITGRVDPELFQVMIMNLAISGQLFIDKPWTIVTYMFTQADFWHLATNMLTLYFFGSFLNRVAGSRNFLLIYFGGGIIGGLFVLLFSSPYVPTIGASGAVFALGGALAIVAPKVKVFIFPIPVPMPLWVAVAIGFLILLPLSFVSWQGHLGGLVFGLLAGLYLRHRLKIAV
jgi:membrane associated rhomboid family serine protease